ncbi:MAG: hypothetical protein AABZ55_00720 [Bdellovibrionota bacterium]
MTVRLNEFKVRVISTNGFSETGTVKLQTWNKKDRIARAIKAWFFCWLAAVLSVLIPILHFILVPAFFFSGPIVAFIFYHQEEILLGGRSRCPACSVDFAIAKMDPHFPLHDICSHCQESVRIEKIE